MDKLPLSPPDSDLRFKIATLNLHVRLPEKVFTNRVSRSPGKHKSHLCATERRRGRPPLCYRCGALASAAMSPGQCMQASSSLFFLFEKGKKIRGCFGTEQCVATFFSFRGTNLIKMRSSAGGPSLTPPSPAPTHLRGGLSRPAPH